MLGFFVSTIASMSEMATRGKLTSDQSGQVLIDTFKELGGYTPDVVEHIHMLAQAKQADFQQGAKNAAKLIAYMYGGAGFDGVRFEHDPVVKDATEITRQNAAIIGTSADGRAAIGGSLMFLLFSVPVERRLGM